MTPERWETFTNRVHVGVVITVAWLVLTGRWIGMLRRIPHDAGFFNYAHVVVGFVALLLGAVYAYACVRVGRWRLYFPWAAGRLGECGRDFAGLLRGRIPSADGGGLFATIEGLALVALLFTGLTGAAWFLAQGTSAALWWRGHHVHAAEALVALVIAHVVAVALHFVDFVRES
jgi:hypothetical protein